MNNRLIISFFLLLILGCDGPMSPEGSPQLKAYNAGETVYVCGCPSGCSCNIVAPAPGGNCACNMPLEQGTVVNGNAAFVTVQLKGRQKTFSLQ